MGFINQLITGGHHPAGFFVFLLDLGLSLGMTWWGFSRWDSDEFSAPWSWCAPWKTAPQQVRGTKHEALTALQIWWSVEEHLWALIRVMTQIDQIATTKSWEITSFSRTHSSSYDHCLLIVSYSHLYLVNHYNGGYPNIYIYTYIYIHIYISSLASKSFTFE